MFVDVSSFANLCSRIRAIHPSDTDCLMMFKYQRHTPTGVRPICMRESFMYACVVKIYSDNYIAKKILSLNTSPLPPPHPDTYICCV